MSWIEVVVAAITSGLVIGIVEIIRDWKNKRGGDKIKNKNDDYTAQKQGLDLVSEFYNRLKPILDGNRDDLKQEMDKIQATVTEIKDNQALMAAYLDGPYQNWIKENYGITG